MKTYFCKLIGMLVFLSLLIGIDTLLYTDADENYSVRIGNGTKITWNNIDITDKLLYMPNFDINENVSYFYVEPLSTLEFEDPSVPIDGYELVILNPATTINERCTTGTKIAFLWSSLGPHYSQMIDGQKIWLDQTCYTYAISGRKIAEVSFAGIDEKNLISVTQNGIVLQFGEPGKYELSYEVMDSTGAVRSGSSFEFNIA